MDEKELKHLKELEAKGSGRTEGENQEYEALSEKRTEAENLKSAVATWLQNETFVKGFAKDISKFQRENDKEETAGHKMSDMLKALKSGNPQSIKAASPMNETTPGDGGYLVPAITQARILELLPTYGQARQLMTSFPMTGNEITIPKESTNPTWTWGITENSEITSSKPTLSTITLTPKKGGALVVLSSELVNDANVNIGDYVIRKIAQAKGIGEDQQFFKGTGSPFTGIFNANNTFGSTITASGNGTTITYQNLIDAMYGVDQNYLVNGRWIFSRTQAASIRGLKDSQGRPLIEPASTGMPATLFGLPIVVVENAPSTATVASQTQVLLGDLSNSYIGDVEGMRMDYFREATIDGTSLAQYDLVAFRVLARTAFSKGLTEKYSRIRQSA